MDHPLPHPALRHSLPIQTGAFVGRVAEISSFCELLGDPHCRLLTLAGPGGIGKTRLALEIAARLINDYSHGAAFVSLVSLASPENMVPAIATALGYQFHADPRSNLQQLLDYFSEKHLLLILDNFEHLLEGAGLVSDILATAPAVKILATSREILNLQEEWAREVSGLVYPDESQLLVAEQCDAVRLFGERARQVRGDFVLRDELPKVVQICQLVEGMPLALELAAYWCKMLSCDEIANQIQQGVDFLTSTQKNVPPRHRSVRAIFDHSWLTLGEGERQALERLSVFRGSFALEAALKVTDASLPTLAALVDKSLVRKLPSGRYELHELLRQYAEDRLIEANRSGGAHDKHCRYYSHFMEAREDDLKGRRQLEALKEIEEDFENVRAAWYWAVRTRRIEAVGRMLEALNLFCSFRSRDQAGFELFEHARVEFAPADGESPHIIWACLLNRFVNNALQKKAQFELVLSIALDHENHIEAGLALSTLAFIARLEARDHRPSLSLYLEALSHFEQADDSFNMAAAQMMVGHEYMMLGKRELAEQFLMQSLTLRRKIGDKIGEAHSLHNLNAFLSQVGETHRTIDYARQCYELSSEMNDLANLAMIASNLSNSMSELGEVAQARSFAEESLRIATYLNAGHIKGRALLSLGFVLCAEARYHEAKVALEASLPLVAEHPVVFSWPHLGLAIADVALDQYQRAKHHFLQVYDGSRRANFLVAVMPPLIAYPAYVIAREGQPGQAAELLGMLHACFPERLGQFQTQPYLATLPEALKSELGVAPFHSAWERGKQLHPEQTIAAVMAKFQAHFDALEPATNGIPERVLRANEALPEPLTRRELEMLRQLPSGLANAEIAAKMVVTVGNVKKHLQNAYGKLDVGNRTEAINRARELGLL